jgi:hypothetical protein
MPRRRCRPTLSVPAGSCACSTRLTACRTWRMRSWRGDRFHLLGVQRRNSPHRGDA